MAFNTREVTKYNNLLSLVFCIFKYLIYYKKEEIHVHIH